MVSAVGRHQIGEIQATRFHFHQNLLGRGVGVGDLLHFENFRTAKASNDECLHGESLAVRERVRRARFGHL